MCRGVMGRRVRDSVVNEAAPDFFHRHPFELERARSAGLGVEPDARAAPELLGAQSRYIDEKKAAVNRRSRFGWNLRGAGVFVQV